MRLEDAPDQGRPGSSGSHGAIQEVSSRLLVTWAHWSPGHRMEVWAGVMGSNELTRLLERTRTSQGHSLGTKSRRPGRHPELGLFSFLRKERFLVALLLVCWMLFLSPRSHAGLYLVTDSREHWLIIQTECFWG